MNKHTDSAGSLAIHRNAASRATGRDLYAAKSNTARRIAPERSTGRDWNAAGTGRGCQLGNGGPTKGKRGYRDNLNKA